MKDSYLWDKFRGGDKSAVEKIYFSHYEKLIRYGLRFTDDVHLLEDCIQDLFIYIIRNHSSLGTTDNITFYLFKSLRRRIAKTVKNYSFYTEYDALTKVEHSNNEISIGATDYKLSDYKSVFDILNKLPERQKEIVYLKYCNNLNNQEIAEILEIKNQTVRNLLYRALKTLRHKITNPIQKNELAPYALIISAIQSFFQN